MKQVYLFLFVFFSIYFIGCKKQDRAESLSPLPLFKIENTQGQNLLDPATVGYFEHEKIRKYDLVNGAEKLYYKPNLDHPYGYIIDKTSIEGYIMLIAPNKEESESPTTTYVDWGNGDIGTRWFLL